MAVKTAGPFPERAHELTAASRRGRRLHGAAVAGAVIVASALLFWCYARLSATFPAGSDGASNALEAWDLLHGNVLLHGWTLTDVSFYPTELPEYAAIEAVRGLGPGVVHTAAALTYTLLVLAAAALARGRARGSEGMARALIAAGIMIAPQLGNGIHVLLSQPDHVGTQVLLLGIFLLVDRAPRRWYTAAAVWALLTVAGVADKITIIDAAVPLAFAGSLALAAVLRAAWASRRDAHRHEPPRSARRSGARRSGARRSGARRSGARRSGARRSGARRCGARRFSLSPAEHQFELWLAVAAVAAAGSAWLLLIAIRVAGGFTLIPVKSGLTTPAGVPAHLILAWRGVLNLYGADVTAAPAGPQSVLAWLHAPGVALAVAAVAVAAWRVPARRDLVAGLLAVGVLVNLAGFIVSEIPASPFDTREIAALLPFGAVLAGRVFGPGLAAAGRPLARPAAAGLAGACQLAALGYGAAQPAAPGPEQALAGWLAAHGLTSGLGTFTEDNVAALDSGGTVRLRTVSWLAPSRYSAGGAVPRLYQSSAAWYDPRTQHANFVVTGAADGTADLIPRAAILALAGGPPARTYHFLAFTIMVWDENLLARLGGPPSHVPGDVGRS